MKKGVRLNFFVKLTILVVICFCAVNIIHLHASLNDLKEQEAELLAKEAELNDRFSELVTEYDREMDRDYIIRIAREKLNYYLPDEVIFFNDR